MKNFARLVLLLALVSAAQAQGTYEALHDYTIGTSGSVPNTAGWSFTPQESIHVTDLGCLDYVVTPQGPVDIGLWASTGQLLAQTTIYATNTLINVSRYVSISPLFLNGGTSYRIGIWSASGLFLDAAGPGIGGSATLSSDLTLDGLALATNGGGLVFPDQQGSAGTMIIGANFLYDRIPEPSVSALLALGGLLLGLRKLR
jgi:hypothetical protein